MIQKPKSLVDQLYGVRGKAEIIDGEIVLMSPASYRHHRKGNRIYRSLEDHEELHGGGAAFGDNLGFIVDLPHRQSFSPDTGWIVDPPDEEWDDFIEGAPAFAVEVRSKTNYGPAADEAIRAKIDDYFATGTLVVWDVDLKRDKCIRCYRAGNPSAPQVFNRGDIADAEPAVPGWRFEVDLLFR